MSLIHYHVICRDCSGYDGITHMSMVLNKNFIADDTTDYTLSQLIKKINGEHLSCKNCGSENYEVFNLVLNDTKYYDSKFISNRCDSEGRYLISFFIVKNEGYPVYHASRSQMPLDILKGLILEMKRIVTNTPRNYFTNIDTHGQFYLFISCDEHKSYRIEKLSITGVEYDEVIEELDYYLEDTLDE